VLTVLRVAAVALLCFSGYVGMVYGAAARGILRHAGIRYRRWDRGGDVIHRFCLLAVQEQRPWRGRVLRDTRRVLLAGMAAGFTGLALLAVPALIKIL
jgi:hypothetical protein